MEEVKKEVVKRKEVKAGLVTWFALPGVFFYITVAKKHLTTFLVCSVASTACRKMDYVRNEAAKDTLSGTNMELLEVSWMLGDVGLLLCSFALTLFHEAPCLFSKERYRSSSTANIGASHRCRNHQGMPQPMTPIPMACPAVTPRVKLPTSDTPRASSAGYKPVAET